MAATPCALALRAAAHAAEAADHGVREAITERLAVGGVFTSRNAETFSAALLPSASCNGACSGPFALQAQALVHSLGDLPESIFSGKKNLPGQPKSFAIAAVDRHSVPVGVISGFVRQLQSGVHTFTVIEVGALVVAKANRRMGIAGFLIGLAKAIARALNGDRAIIVLKASPASVPLYESHQFITHLRVRDVSLFADGMEAIGLAGIAAVKEATTLIYNIYGQERGYFWSSVLRAQG
jgi:hypothetical protein